MVKQDPDNNPDQQNANTASAPVIGVSIGDINGINFELILKTFSDERVLNYCTPVIYASTRVANYHKKTLGFNDFHLNIIKSAGKASAQKVNLINVWDEEPRVQLGYIKEEAGGYAIKSLDTVVQDLQNGLLDGMVTAPLSKHTVDASEGRFSGHTEYLQRQFNTPDTLMLMNHEQLKVGVVTTHLPLNEVPENVTHKGILRKIQLLHNSLVQDFRHDKPRMAVLGLNPHAGDQGLLGDEEDRVVAPAIAEAWENNYLAFGPYPADGFFGSQTFQSFDAVLALYHDQGLIPFKALTFGEGVNYTAGLPVVRTSPDHGPGYALAGKNQADEGSFRQAIFQAVQIARNRKEYADLTANPLGNRMTHQTEKS